MLRDARVARSSHEVLCFNQVDLIPEEARSAGLEGWAAYRFVIPGTSLQYYHADRCSLLLNRSVEAKPIEKALSQLSLALLRRVLIVLVERPGHEREKYMFARRI